MVTWFQNQISNACKSSGNIELMVISHENSQALYPQSHGWERFGRILAEQYFVYSQSKSEALLGHLASYLGIKGPSLSRIRANIAGNPAV